eukprot:TRINITY_DN75078_c0_g1_i1.p1 TRINITY_DN75078_c0_g1~~TRINITY_DN75078_c0_g1_i1.p1  ORF type:complete len:301 (+),score=74.43 TRINITY_DN75078_c0_g1_i1:60-962(+)
MAAAAKASKRKPAAAKPRAPKKHHAAAAKPPRAAAARTSLRKRPASARRPRTLQQVSPAQDGQAAGAREAAQHAADDKVVPFERHMVLCRLAVRLLNAPIPKSSAGLEAVYLFHQLDANVDSSVAATAELIRQEPRTIVLVTDVHNERLGKPLTGDFGSAPLLLEKLQAAGVGRQQIELVDFDHSGMIHTLIEAETIVRHAKRRGFRSLAVLAPAFHLLRSAMTTASVAMKEYDDLRVYPLAGVPLSWQEASQHSQGMAASTRAAFINTELSRIHAYTEKGDIAAWEQIEEFFARCDSHG